jgi:hypothetical protein
MLLTLLRSTVIIPIGSFTANVTVEHTPLFNVTVENSKTFNV